MKSTLLRDLKKELIEYYNQIGVDTNDYQFKKELYARLLLANYYITPVFCIKSTCTHNGEKQVLQSFHRYREMSIDSIVGTLVHHENSYCEKFREQVELDIDDMTETLIQLFERGENQIPE